MRAKFSWSAAFPRPRDETEEFEEADVSTRSMKAVPCAKRFGLQSSVRFHAELLNSWLRTRQG